MSESNKVLENISLNSPLREKRNSSNGKSSASKKIKSSENFYIEDSLSRAKCKYGREETIFKKVDFFFVIFREVIFKFRVQLEIYFLFFCRLKIFLVLLKRTFV